MAMPTDWARKVAAFLCFAPPCAWAGPRFDPTPLWEAAGADGLGPGFASRVRRDVLSAVLPDPDAPPADAAPWAVHPLSGRRRELPGLDRAGVEAHVLGVLRALVAKAGGGPGRHERLFLLLWRSFGDELERAAPHVPWRILPCDPRVPAYTWEDAASVAAAYVAAGDDPAVVVFTIASAQAFVGAARRTQDAWMGSFLLSYLSWAAMGAVAERFGPDAVVSPGLRGQPLADEWLRATKGLGAVLEPPAEDRVRVANVPNLFTAIVPAAAAERVAEACEQAVRRAWGRVARCVKEDVERALERKQGRPGRAWHEIWQRQVHHFPDRLGLFWGAASAGEAGFPRLLEAGLANPEDRHALLRVYGRDSGGLGARIPWLSALAARAMSGRKNVRDFRQVPEPGHKCTLCGEREALHGEDASPATYRQLSTFWAALAGLDRDRPGERKLLGRIRTGEKLCAVCLTKRLALDAVFENLFGIDHHVFPSTSTVAASRFMREMLASGDEKLSARLRAHARLVSDRLASPPAKWPRAVQALLGTLGEGRGYVERMDGDWLYPDSFQRDPIERELGQAPRGEDLAELRRGAVEIRQAAASLGIAAPPTYYAVVAMDGDKMGDWIIGKQGPRWAELLAGAPSHRLAAAELRRPGDPLAQGVISEALRVFSLEEVPRLVEERCGTLVYAGGDDVLALFPLFEVLPAVEALQRAYRGGAGLGFLEAGGRVRRVPGAMTISAGIAVVHRSHDLSQALQAAHELLEEAKDTYGRNAFCVGILRRSGEHTRVGWRFPDPGEPGILGPVQRFVDWFRAGEVSTRLAYRVGSLGWARGWSDPAPLRTEVMRLVRQHVKRDWKEFVEAVGKEMERLLTHLVEDRPTNPVTPNDRYIRERGLTLWESLARLLDLAVFLSGRDREG